MRTYHVDISCGHGASRLVDILRTGQWPACGQSEDFRNHRHGHLSGHGLNADADWTWTRTVCGHCLSVACSRTWTGHGHGLAGRTRRGHSASFPRPLRGHRILRWRRSRACLGLNMTEIGLIRLLKNFVPPVFNLLGDVLNVADLPDGL